MASKLHHTRQLQRTLFTTPVVNTVLRVFSQQFLKRTGWRVDGALPPEGTRSKTRYWKTGFYYIALEATVPAFAPHYCGTSPSTVQRRITRPWVAAS